MADPDTLIAGLSEEPEAMTLSHDRLVLQRAEANGDQVVVVRCPHTIGLCFLTDYGGKVGEMLGLLPCPCNDPCEIVARIVPTPKRPKEPKGRGAQVRDGNGLIWGAADRAGDHYWIPDNVGGSTTNWDYIPEPVTVLHEGWESDS